MRFSQPATIIALAQTLLIVLGIIILGIVLKMSGYPDNPVVRWDPLAVFLHDHGLWLILLPTLWVLWANSARRTDDDFYSYRMALVLGFCIGGLIFATFLCGAARPFTRPLFIHFQS